jgi:flagella basal body P-ring formation protein FlgA
LALILTCVTAPAFATQDPARVQAVAETFLRGQLASLPGRATIEIEPPQNTRLAACDALAPFLPAGMRPRARMTVGVRCHAPQSWTTYVQATVAVSGTYYVTRQPIAMGHVLSEADLEARKGDLLALSAQMALLPDQLVGRVANRRLQAGRPIRLDALRSPQAIQRGEAVRLVVQGPGFTATGTGRAMGNAAPGASLQVRTDSGQVVTGTVTDTGTVQIGL